MESSDGDLAQRLCVLAGMMMEDHSTAGVSLLSSDGVERRQTLRRLRRAGDEIAMLLAAAAVVNRHIGAQNQES